ncbi:MAG TPA: SMP-30/gluconolactonase/LRE family protein [Gemmataceae bacterium]|jgi:sugar lactone lactonase YvrE
MSAARVLFAPPAEDDRFLPESPHAVTVAGRPALAWVNIQTAEHATRGAVHLRSRDTGEHRVLPQPARPGFLALTDRSGVVFVGREKELGTLDLQTGAWTHLAAIPDDNPRTIINDGAPTPDGRGVVFGTKDLKFKDPIAALYLFTAADRRVTVLAIQQTCSNGKVFGRNAGGVVLYDIDTPRRVVARYHLDADRRTGREEGVAVDLRAVDGFPDGMADAGDGTAVIAIYNPGKVADGRAYHYDLRTGERLGEWVVPGSPRVTCPLLVERDGGVKLVLTTAVEGMPPDQRRLCPHAGDLFIADTGLRVVPEPARVRLG